MLFLAMSCCFRQPAPVLTCFRTIGSGVRCFARQSDSSINPPFAAPPAAPARMDLRTGPSNVPKRSICKNDLARRFFEEKRRRENEMNQRLKAIEPTRPAPPTNTMNNPNPLIPQGSLLEQKAQSRPHLRIAIAIVAVHL